MGEKVAKTETKVSTREVTELGDRAVALLGERSESGYRTGFDPYGGLETHVAGFELEDGVIIRIGTLQDWDGNNKRPDFHAVVIRPTEGTTDTGEPIVQETTYTFFASGFARRYRVRAHEEQTSYSQDEPRRTGANRQILNLKDGLEAAGMLSETNFPYRQVHTVAKPLNFDSSALEELSDLVAKCGLQNLVYLDAGSATY